MNAWLEASPDEMAIKARPRSDAHLSRSITRKRLDISVPAKSDASEFCAESEVLEDIQRLIEVDLDEEA
jgi:hypothetical protein